MYVSSGIMMPFESSHISSLKMRTGPCRPTIRNGTPSTRTSRPTGSAPPNSFAPRVEPTTATVLWRRRSSSVRPRPAAIGRFMRSA